MLAAAADKAKSLDPIKVARALEGMEIEVFDGGKGYMRKDDHQFFQPIYISSLGERTAKEPFDEEKTGWGWKPVAKIDTPGPCCRPPARWNGRTDGSRITRPPEISSDGTRPLFPAVRRA